MYERKNRNFKNSFDPLVKLMNSRLEIHGRCKYDPAFIGSALMSPARTKKSNNLAQVPTIRLNLIFIVGLVVLVILMVTLMHYYVGC